MFCSGILKAAFDLQCHFAKTNVNNSDLLHLGVIVLVLICTSKFVLGGSVVLPRIYEAAKESQQSFNFTFIVTRQFIFFD